MEREGPYAKVGAVAGVLGLLIAYLGLAATTHWVPFTVRHPSVNPPIISSSNSGVAAPQSSGSRSAKPSLSAVYRVSLSKMLCDEADGSACLKPVTDLIGTKYLENSSISDSDVYPSFSDVIDIKPNKCFAATLKYGIGTDGEGSPASSRAMIKIIQRSGVLQDRTPINTIGTVHLRVDGGPITILGSSTNCCMFSVFQVAGYFRCHSVTGY
jgi:hypothetical protein